MSVSPRNHEEPVDGVSYRARLIRVGKLVPAAEVEARTFDWSQHGMTVLRRHPPEAS
jgi:hypothetical protein